MSKRRLIQPLTLVVVALLGASSLLQAEVAVHTTLGKPPTTTLSGIVVDPDPINGDWGVTGPGNPNKFVLNPGGDTNGDGRPSAAFAPNSLLPSVVWAKHTPSGFDVVISRFDGNGWSAAALVSGEAADELDPRLVIDPADGSHHVVYWIKDAAPRVLYRWAPADLSSWSAAVQLSQLTEIAVRPSLTIFDGQLHVTYELHSSGFGLTPRQIAVAVWNGQGFTSQIVATTQHGGANWPTLHSVPTRLWVEWIDSGSEVAWTRREPAVSWGAIATVPFESDVELFHAPGAVRRLALE